MALKLRFSAVRFNRLILVMVVSSGKATAPPEGRASALSVYSAAINAQLTMALHTELQRPNPL